jgi:hypothetical protein
MAESRSEADAGAVVMEVMGRTSMRAGPKREQGVESWNSAGEESALGWVEQPA